MSKRGLQDANSVVAPPPKKKKIDYRNLCNNGCGRHRKEVVVVEKTVEVPVAQPVTVGASQPFIRWLFSTQTFPPDTVAVISEHADSLYGCLVEHCKKFIFCLKKTEGSVLEWSFHGYFELETRQSFQWIMANVNPFLTLVSTPNVSSRVFWDSCSKPVSGLGPWILGLTDPSVDHSESIISFLNDVKSQQVSTQTLLHKYAADGTAVYPCDFVSLVRLMRTFLSPPVPGKALNNKK